MRRIVGLASCEVSHRFADALAYRELESRSIYRWQLGFYRDVHCEIICEVLKLLQVFYLIKALS